MASNFEQNRLMRTFDSGATRTSADLKVDYEGFLSPIVLKRYGEYMHQHRFCPDGTVRDSDNWQLGIPTDQYIKSGYRHFMDWWMNHRGYETETGMQETLCALIFNASGYLHEILRETDYGKRFTNEHAVANPDSSRRNFDEDRPTDRERHYFGNEDLQETTYPKMVCYPPESSGKPPTSGTPLRFERYTSSGR